jgi:hypothetical protein
MGELIGAPKQAINHEGWVGKAGDGLRKRSCGATTTRGRSFPPFPFHTHRDGILTLLSESLTKEMCDSFVMMERHFVMPLCSVSPILYNRKHLAF